MKRPVDDKTNIQAFRDRARHWGTIPVWRDSGAGFEVQSWPIGTPLPEGVVEATDEQIMDVIQDYRLMTAELDAPDNTKH